jgi:hypothetical protein
LDRAGGNTTTGEMPAGGLAWIVAENPRSVGADRRSTSNAETATAAPAADTAIHAAIFRQPSTKAILFGLSDRAAACRASHACRTATSISGRTTAPASAAASSWSAASIQLSV